MGHFSRPTAVGPTNTRAQFGSLLVGDVDGDGQATFRRSDQRFRYDREGAPAVGDFNGDARPDIFAGSQRGAYRIWFNQGDGTFGPNPPAGR